MTETVKARGEPACKQALQAPLQPPWATCAPIQSRQPAFMHHGGAQFGKPLKKATSVTRKTFLLQCTIFVATPLYCAPNTSITLLQGNRHEPQHRTIHRRQQGHRRLPAGCRQHRPGFRRAHRRPQPEHRPQRPGRHRFRRANRARRQGSASRLRRPEVAGPAGCRQGRRLRQVGLRNHQRNPAGTGQDGRSPVQPVPEIGCRHG